MTYFLSSTLIKAISRELRMCFLTLRSHLHSHSPYFAVCFAIPGWFKQVHCEGHSISSCHYFAFDLYKDIGNNPKFFSITLALSISIIYYLSISISKTHVNARSSVQVSRSVMSDSLRPHGLQHTRLPYPSLTPGDYSNSFPSSWWCYPTISSSAVPFSSCLQSFPASVTFPMSQFFASGGQSIGALASALVLPVNIQDWFPLGWTGWISLQSKGLSRVFSNITFQKHQFFGAQLSLRPNSHICTWLL